MEVIKRDNRAVEYDSSKIRTAIEKANKEVKPRERATKEEVDKIIEYIEDTDKKRILVEDIQDIIEEQLMDMKRFTLAKKYMIYRYTRALVRKANTTDEIILGIIKKQSEQKASLDLDNKASKTMTQREYIAAEVSKDLTQRILLPEKIVNAHKDGVIYFHDMEYFVQPIFNSSVIDIKDMLEIGTVINGKLIEPPKSFQVACTVMTQIIGATSASQAGYQTVCISHLGKYVKMSYEKFKREIEKDAKNEVTSDVVEKLARQRLRREICAGVQTIGYQLNTMVTTKGEPPCVTLFLYLDKEDPYIKENAMIIEEIIRQRYEGMKNEKGESISPDIPKLVYVLDENNNLNGGEYDYLTKLAIKCSARRRSPEYISAKKMRDNFEGNVFSPIGESGFLTPLKDKDGNYKSEGRFNQGIISINLPQIALAANDDEEKFWKLLDDRLELCKEAIGCKHNALNGTSAEVSPIIWKYGAISRLKQDEKIDKLLKEGYSTIMLGYVGLEEMTKVMKKASYVDNKGNDFGIKVLEHLRETVDTWSDDAKISITLYEVQDEDARKAFAKKDKQKYGTIEGITDKECYSSSHVIKLDSKEDVQKLLRIEDEVAKISNGGAIATVEMPKTIENLKELEDLVKYVASNVQYVRFK